MTYATQTELERFLSAAGVTDFADHDGDGTADAGVVQDCLDQADAEINAYAMQRYDATGLAGSVLINRWAVTLAAYFLCQRRGNPPPVSVEAEFMRLMDVKDGLLPALGKGLYQLPQVALRADLRPTFSNVTVDRRYPRSKIRVQKSISSDAPTVLTQDSESDVVHE